ncbi:MAG: ABC transporter substrate-binding protein, partial [Burkholderiales bacterium]|nr:ABC transporter substrate-binding protein [Burkholderiales bacterium]
MKIVKLFGVAATTSALLCTTGLYAQEIKLGVIAGMSGAGTSYGIGIQQGAEMAVKEINAAGGVKG